MRGWLRASPPTKELQETWRLFLNFFWKYYILLALLSVVSRYKRNFSTSKQICSLQRLILKRGSCLSPGADVKHALHQLLKTRVQHLNQKLILSGTLLGSNIFSLTDNEPYLLAKIASGSRVWKRKLGSIPLIGSIWLIATDRSLYSKQLCNFATK